MSASPQFTILLAAYDRPDLLKAAVDSALSQVFVDFEVLVVDDGSGPETRDWLDEAAAAHPNLRVIHQANQGVAVARQRGLEEARGEYVCILDSDDLLMPVALTVISHHFKGEDPPDLVYCNNRHLTGNGASFLRSYPKWRDADHFIWLTFLRPRVPFKHSGTTFRRDVALELGGYDTDLRIKIDIDFFLKFMANKRKMVLEEAPLVEFRMHRDSISARRVEGLKVWLKLVDRYVRGGPVKKLGYKAMRGGSELAKLAYLLVRMR